jgi:hypothetical protein
MTRAAAKAALKRLDVFIGEWTLEASFPGAPPGRAVFEWTLGGQFLVQRTQAPDPAPDNLAIISVNPDRGTYTQHYFDTRGVARVYEMKLTRGAWTLLRVKPDFSPLNFSQRFKGKFSADGNVISGMWETSSDGKTWKRDFDLTYRRLKRRRATSFRRKRGLDRRAGA